MRAMIVRSDKSGLGYQTRNLARMLKPQKIMLIDSTPFNGADQHPDWYDGFPGIVVKGFPNKLEKRRFLQGVTSLITCEIPYGYDLLAAASQQGAKTYLQYNYEFCDYLREPRLPQPTIFLSPSYWHLEEMQRLFPERVQYLPPPVFPAEFLEAKETNFSRTGRRRFLHIVGRPAVGDRNGTQSLLTALKHTDMDFDLVIKAQGIVSPDTSDRRVTFDYGNPDDQAELYKNFDAVIMPRRYGGLCLPMIEALISGLPVIMTDVSPNNAVLPPAWLVPAQQTSSLMTRTMLEVFGADPVALARKIEEFCAMPTFELDVAKGQAFGLGYENYSADALRPKYEETLR